MSDQRIPPQSIEAEKALLCSILIKADAMYEVMDYIHADVFYEPKHRTIFESINELFAEQSAIDMLTVCEKLRVKKHLDGIGGETYIAELSTTVPTATNIEHYAQIVFNHAVRRKLIQASEEIAHVGYDHDGHIEEAIDKSEKHIFAISQSLSNSEFIDMNTLAREAAERMLMLQDGGRQLRGIPTGFSNLDAKLAGFQPSDLIILAARPSVGKTSLALDFVRKTAIGHGKSVAFFSLEMSKDQLIDRMLSAEARVDYWKMRTGSLKDNNDFGALQDAIGRLSESKIFIDDNSYNNVLRMKSAARKLKRKHGLDMIVVDYLQLMAPMNVGKNSSPVQEVTEISRGLKQLAKELDVPVIALSQLSRNIEHRGNDSRPRLADLRDSGSIEQDADVVLFIHRPKEDEENAGRGAQTELIIEKHRNGATGTVELYFDGEKTSFYEMDSVHTGTADDFASQDAQTNTDEF